jgi:hypothetical protein
MVMVLTKPCVEHGSLLSTPLPSRCNVFNKLGRRPLFGDSALFINATASLFFSFKWAAGTSHRPTSTSQFQPSAILSCFPHITYPLWRKTTNIKMVLHNSILTLATGLTLAASCVVAAPPSPPSPSSPPCPPLPPAAVPQGKIEGFRDEHCNAVYLGVPFAASTGGQNR